MVRARDDKENRLLQERQIRLVRTFEAIAAIKNNKFQIKLFEKLMDAEISVLKSGLLTSNRVDDAKSKESQQYVDKNYLNQAIKIVSKLWHSGNR